MLNSIKNKLMDKKVEYEDYITRRDLRESKDFLDEIRKSVSPDKKIIRYSWTNNKKRQLAPIDLKREFFTSEDKNMKGYISKYRESITNSIGNRRKLVFNSDTP